MDKLVPTCTSNAKIRHKRAGIQVLLMIAGSKEEILKQTGSIEATNVFGLIALTHAVFTSTGKNYREIAVGKVNFDRNFSSTTLNPSGPEGSLYGHCTSICRARYPFETS